MRFTIKIIFILMGITILFNSCNNDLKILAPYKEAVSVYGILNPQETRQYIRINKIFLGEGNAYAMAKVSDSVNYAAGLLTVTLDHSGSTCGYVYKNQITLRDTMMQIQTGTFSTDQRLYYTDDRLFPCGDYKLTIKNNHTGNVFTSKTTMIDSVGPFFAPLAPPYYPVLYNPTNPPSYYIDYAVAPANSDRTLTVSFFPPAGGAEYTGIIRFCYIDSLLGGVTVPHSVDFNLSNLPTSNLVLHPTFGTYYGSFSFTTIEFLNKISSQIALTPDPINLVGRRAIRFDYIITAISTDFHDFLQISAPSTSVAQDKPAYSNITGGFGIFACRSRFWVKKHLANTFLDYMSSKKPMCSRYFVNSAGGLSFTCN